MPRNGNRRKSPRAASRPVNNPACFRFAVFCISVIPYFIVPFLVPFQLFRTYRTSARPRGNFRHLGVSPKTSISDAILLTKNISSADQNVARIFVSGARESLAPTVATLHAAVIKINRSISDSVLIDETLDPLDPRRVEETAREDALPRKRKHEDLEFFLSEEFPRKYKRKLKQQTRFRSRTGLIYFISESRMSTL